MSLRGELREFELPDILQLIASQKKAGWLKVISRGVCHFVFFRDGKITSTKNPAEEEDPLEEYITRRKLLTDDQLDRLAATRRKTGMDVHDILLKEGLLNEDDIQEIFEAMVEHDIFELMSIRSGTYEFETEDRPGPVPEGALHAEIGPILMEGARKADEVAEMRRVLGPDDGTLVLTTMGRAAEPEYSDESILLELVNGTRTIDALIEESGLDRYTATRALFDCARQGWIKVSRSRDAEPEPGSQIEGEFDARKTLRWITPVLAFLLAGVFYGMDIVPIERTDPILGEYLQQSGTVRTAELRESVLTAVEVYRVRRGAYPSTLDALLDEGLVRDNFLRRGEDERWAYRVREDGRAFALTERAGP
ncbi:DUF4388 domain-containing protein [bacterium]|nr:DUF4388 domain-containing protein [bacterium]